MPSASFSRVNTLYWFSWHTMPNSRKSRSSSPVFKTCLAKFFLQFFKRELRRFLFSETLAVVLEPDVRFPVHVDFYHVHLVRSLPQFAKQPVLKGEFILLAEDLELALVILVGLHKILQVHVNFYDLCNNEMP